MYSMYFNICLCKPEHAMSKLMKKVAKEAYDKEISSKLYSVDNVFLTKREVLTHKAAKRIILLNLRHSNIRVQYVTTGLKMNRISTLKPQSILEAMHPDDTNIYANN